MHILVVNSGSSSIKYQLLIMPEARLLCSGLVERIGEPGARVVHTVAGAPESHHVTRVIDDHAAGLRLVVDLLAAGEGAVVDDPRAIAAVGHRVVHGGERFRQPTRIDAAVKAAIRDLSPLAPLHNPANLTGIEVAERLFPHAAQIAVFDTAFHQSMPAHAFRYAIPADLYLEEGLRVYGFHGTSHAYVAEQAARMLDKPPDRCNLITAHLGNGASMAAIRNGLSVDTSMGFTPLPGLVMGTRSGDVDPALIFYLHDRLGHALPEIDRLLNKESGLLGLCGDNDLRDIQRRADTGDADAVLALAVYTYRIRKYVGAYLAVLGRVDALVFTAGVGENSARIRAQVCEDLDLLGIELDPARNAATVGGAGGPISTDQSRIGVLVIPTNEEVSIAQQSYQLLCESHVTGEQSDAA